MKRLALSLTLILLAVACFTASAALLLIHADSNPSTGNGDERVSVGLTLPKQSETGEAEGDDRSSDATPAEEPSRPGIERLVIPRVGIDAPAVQLGVDDDGAMQSP